jgi:hypothetical protein
VNKNEKLCYNRHVTTNKGIKTMENLNIRELNRFAWWNDYSFDWNGHVIYPVNGSYNNGYSIL